MPRLDIDEIRKNTVLLHGLRDVNGINTFYYDETNNIRKYYLTRRGVNVDKEENFVLGGIMYFGNESIADLNDLFRNLNLQKTTKELKLKHIARGNFINCLTSKKLNVLLKWLLDSDLFIHYTNVNILYYSIVDIVDSIILDSSAKYDIYFSNFLKNNLYKLVTLEKELFLKLFYSFQYPNIKKEEVSNFIDELMHIIEKYVDFYELHLGLSHIKQLLNEAKRYKNLCFIMDEKDYVLISDFVDFYLRPIYIFKNSKHYFDKEASVEDILNSYDLYDGGKVIKQYSFIESHINRYVQISDVVTGLLGKFFTFVNLSSLEEIKSLELSLNTLQMNNLKLLSKLIHKSENKNRALLLSVTSDEEKLKISHLNKLF